MPKIEFQPSGIIKDVPYSTRLYDIAHESGLDWMFGCTKGNCGTCLSTVVSGIENLNRIGNTEGETLRKLGAMPGQRLACQLIIRGDAVLHKEKFGEPDEDK
jgi:ferredoxin